MKKKKFFQQILALACSTAIIFTSVDLSMLEVHATEVAGETEAAVSTEKATEEEETGNELEVLTADDVENTGLTEDANSVDIAVLTTTDMHGKCWDTNVLNDTSVTNSMLKVSSAASHFREVYGKENVLLLDNGDTFQGTPVSSYSITSATDAFDGVTPMALCLKYLDYDALTLGNHEFNYKWSTMSKIYDYLQDETDGANKVDVLAANLVWAADDTTKNQTAGDNVFTPYIIKEVPIKETGKTAKIGILGLENTDCTRWDITDNYPNIQFAHNTDLDLIKDVEMYVPEMKEAGCDYIIVSYHSGIGSNDGKALEYGVNTENQALRIIANTTGIDMMICGHDHDKSYSNNTYKNKEDKDVLVVNGGGSALTETELTATVGTDGKITFTQDASTTIDLSTYTDDATLKAAIEPFATKAADYVSTACGVLGSGWDTKTSSNDCYLGQTDVMDLVNRSQIFEGAKQLAVKYDTPEAKEAVKTAHNFTSVDDVTTVDLSASSVVLGSFKGLKAGEISIKDIYTFYKYDNSLYILPMTGQEIKDALEYIGAQRLGYTIKNGQITYKTINDYFTCAVFYGLDFTYDMSKEEGSRVTITGFANGKTFDLNRTYNLAINNYHLSNGPFAAYKTQDTIWSETDDLGGGNVQDLIADFIEDKGEDGTGVVPKRSNWAITYSAEIPVEEEEEKAPAEVYDPIPDATFATDHPDCVTIAEAELKTSGKGTVVGQVVYVYGGVNYIIEDVINDQIYGYLVYDSANSYTVGDIVEVTGDFTVYSGLPEIKPSAAPKVTKTCNEAEMIQPQVVTVSDILNQTDDEYLNEYVVIQNLPANTATVKDGEDSITLYNGKSLPEGITAGDPIDYYAVCSAYSANYQLRNNASTDYVKSTGIYDPVSDDMFTEGISMLSDIYSAEKDSTATVLGQVAYKYSTSNNAAGTKSNIVLQDVIDGKVVGLVLYDSKNTYNIGDVVKVTGKVSEYNSVKQINPTTVERVKTEICFQPQLVTIKDLGDDYLSEYVQIKDVTLGAYNGSGNTTATDATGNTNIFKGAEFPAKVAANSVVALKGVYSKSSGAGILRVGSSFDYIKGAEEAVVDKTLVRVPVVETSDVHGFLLDVSSGKKDTYQYRMAYIDKVIDNLEANSDVMLLDGGDIYQGNPVSNLLTGQSMTAAYDEMGYDAVALGNHEFDWSVTDLIDDDATMGSYNLANGTIKGDSTIPVVCANMYSSNGTEDTSDDTRVKFTKDYVVIEKEGTALDGTKKTYKIAVFGYAEDYSKDIMAAKIAPYSIHEDDLTKLETQAAALEEAKTVDASIMLSHASAASIAKVLSKDTAFDLVCGGHTHVDATGVATNGVTYIQPKNQAQSYAYAELCFAKDGTVTVENNEIVPVTSDKTALYNTEANAAKLDSEIIKISDAAVAEVAPVMDEQLGTISTQVTKAPINGNTYSSTAGTWMCDQMNAATGADVSFTNNGGIRTEFTYEGISKMLTAGDVYTIAPFCNTLPTFDMTYEDLKGVIEFAVGSSATGLALRMGGATAYYNEAGSVTTLFVGKTLVYNDGAWVVDKTGKVTVCTNEYIATSSGTPFAKLTSNETAAGVLAATDNESFIAALKEEAAANNGVLHVATAPTLASGAWDGTTQPEVYEKPEIKPEVTTYTVNFNANKTGVTGTMAAQTLTKDQAAALTTNAFKLTGYTFAGWATSANGAVVYKNAASVKNLAEAGKSATLYAVWTPITYKVAFYDNSKKATGKMTALTLTYDKAQKLTANKFKLKGYDFTGWATSAKGKVVYKNAASIKNLTATAGTTIKLYAKWSKTTVKTAAISSVKSSKAKTMTIKWKKVSQADGYAISYSTDKSMKKSVKTVYVTKGSTTAKTIKKLKAGKKYYVTVKAYEKDSAGKRVLGKCKAKKVVTIKK